MTDRSPHGAHSHRFPPADNQPHRTLASSPPKAHSKRHSPKPKPCCSPPWPAARAARPSRPPWRTPGKRCVRLGWGDEGLVGCRSATQRGRRHMAGWRRRARDGAHTGAPSPAADRIHKPPHWAFGPLWHGGAGGAPASNRSTRRGHGPGPLPMFFSPALCLADDYALTTKRHQPHSATFASASPAVSALGLDKLGITRPVRSPSIYPVYVSRAQQRGWADRCVYARGD